MELEFCGDATGAGGFGFDFEFGQIGHVFFACFFFNKMFFLISSQRFWQYNYVCFIILYILLYILLRKTVE